MNSRPLWLLGAGLGLLLLVGCGGKETAPDGSEVQQQKLLVYHAASLTQAFAVIEKRMEERHPGLDVICESSSTRLAIRKITDLQRKGDIIGSADDVLVRTMLMPEYTEWQGIFATDRIVLAYTERSRCRSEINAENWYDILLRPDVNYGYSDPNNAPVGYRTQLTWKLATLHYKDTLGTRDLYQELLAGCPEKNIRPHCNELIPLLESLALDYIFEYRSVAMQHRLNWLKLPDEIDLGSAKQAPFYAKAHVQIAGKDRGSVQTVTGVPMLFSATMLKGAQNPEMALEFLQILFGPEGQMIMEDNFQETFTPVYCNEIQAVPEALRGLMRPTDF